MATTARRSCAVCKHPRRAQIDAALAGQEDQLAIAQRFAVTTRKLKAHAPHIAKDAARAGAAASPLPTPPPSRASGDASPARAASCAICEHPQRVQIHAALKEGKTILTVAREFLVSADAIRGHIEDLRRGAEAARAAAAVAPPPGNDSPPAPAPEDDEDVDTGVPAGASALERARLQLARLERHRARVARGDGASVDEVALLKAEEAEGRAIIAYAKLTGEITPANERAIIATRPFQRVLSEVMSVLEPHPEIAEEIAKRLAKLEEIAA